MAFVSDLPGGEQILLSNLDVVQDGSQVKVQSKRTLDEEIAQQTTLRPVQQNVETVDN